MDSEDGSEDEVMIKALVVNDIKDSAFNLDIPPTSGNEYLRRVRMEAKDCPKVVVADIDISPFKSKQTVNVSQSTGGCHPAPRGFAYGISWQKAQVDQFAELRQELARQVALRNKNKVPNKTKLPLCNDVEGWCRLCFGRLSPPGTRTEPVSPQDEGNEDERLKFTGSLPYTNIIMAMDQSAVIKVLEYHINWFEATGFTEKQGCWFYALLCCLQKPLTPEACSLLRSLARNCSNLRATLESPDDSRLVPLNLFICLVAHYFDQMDLADNVT